MTFGQVEVITSVQRRRRWPRAEKERLVSLCLEPGASASDIARSAGIHVSQLFRWRRQFCERTVAEPAFLPVSLAGSSPMLERRPEAPDGPPGTAACPPIEILLSTGDLVRVPDGVDERALRLVVATLRTR
jgi:transposase